MAYVNGLQQQLKRGPTEGQLATLLEDLRASMKAVGDSLVIQFDQDSEITELAAMLKLGLAAEREGVFPTLVGQIAPALNFAYNETERVLNVWPSRR